jgi:hypothetical protein
MRQFEDTIENTLKDIIRKEYAGRFYNGKCCSGLVKSAISTLRRYRANIPKLSKGVRSVSN